MTKPTSDLSAMLRTLEPILHDGVYVYTFSPPGIDVSAVPAVARFDEAEGTTLITTEAAATRSKLTVLFRAAWITLGVNSDLQTVGLTAAFSRALADAGISCNVVAAARHDHIFVPVERGHEALAVLKQLQQCASS